MNHIALKCPMVHVTLNQQKVCKDYAKSQFQERDLKIIRRSRFKINSRGNFLKNQSDSMKFSYMPGSNQIFSIRKRSQILSNPKTLDEINDDYFCDDHYVLSEDICSIEKDVWSQDSFESSSLTKETKGSKMLDSHFFQKQTFDLFYDKFNSEFEKKKDYEIYFPHNNSSEIITRMKPKPIKTFSAQEISIMKAMKKKKQSTSLEKIPFEGIFPQNKIKIPNLGIKIMTNEAISPIFNKKLRQIGNQKLLRRFTSEEKILDKSRKISKGRKLMCCGCFKKIKICSIIEKSK